MQCTSDLEPAHIAAYLPTGGVYPGQFWYGNGDKADITENFEELSNYSAIGNNPDLKVRLLHGKQDLSYTTHIDDARAFAPEL